MLIKEVKFVISSTSYKGCPPPRWPEYAFTGRSNVGKSSLINMLCNRKGLAKISVSPGKTQLINHFLVNNAWYLVDLPGYGYARVSKTNRNQWSAMVNDYLLFRRNLLCTFILIDLRLPPQDIDREMIDAFGENQLPFALVFTKLDKLGRMESERNLEIYKNDLQERWAELPPVFVTSAKTGFGRDEILDHIERVNIVFKAENL